MATKQAIAHRRTRVRELRIRGDSTTQIAEELGCHRNSIINDVKSFREQTTTTPPTPSTSQENVVAALARYDQLYEEMMKQVALAEDVPTKIRALDCARRVCVSKSRLEVETGCLPRAPKVSQIQSNSLVINLNGREYDTQHMSLESLRALRSKMLEHLTEGECGEMTGG